MEPALDDRDKASARPKPASPTSDEPRAARARRRRRAGHRRLIKHTLERSGDGRVEIVSSGDAALRAVTEQTPDLMILDLNLPVLSGTEVCRILRGRPATANVPIIMLTARTAETDRVTGLDLGADDYVTKPFSLRELAARVRAVSAPARSRRRRSAPTSTRRAPDARTSTPSRSRSTAWPSASRAASSSCCSSWSRTATACCRATGCSSACGATTG